MFAVKTWFLNSSFFKECPKPLLNPVELNETESTASENAAIGFNLASILLLCAVSTPKFFDFTISASYELLRIVNVFDGVLFVLDIDPDTLVLACHVLWTRFKVSKSVYATFLFVYWWSPEFGIFPFYFLGPKFIVRLEQGFWIKILFVKALSAASNSIKFSSLTGIA